MDKNNLWDRALSDIDNKIIEREFIKSELPKELSKKLKLLLKKLNIL